MNKYFIGISEPGEDFSGNDLVNNPPVTGITVVHGGDFFTVESHDSDEFSHLRKQSNYNLHKFSRKEISLLKTIEKETFVELVRRMRQHQKDFFTSKPGSQFKAESLQKARAYEKEVDLVLAAMDNTQLKMNI